MTKTKEKRNQSTEIYALLAIVAIVGLVGMISIMTTGTNKESKNVVKEAKIVDEGVENVGGEARYLKTTKSAAMSYPTPIVRTYESDFQIKKGQEVDFYGDKILFVEPYMQLSAYPEDRQASFVINTQYSGNWTINETRTIPSVDGVNMYLKITNLNENFDEAVECSPTPENRWTPFEVYPINSTGGRLNLTCDNWINDSDPKHGSRILGFTGENTTILYNYSKYLIESYNYPNNPLVRNITNCTYMGTDLMILNSKDIFRDITAKKDKLRLELFRSTFKMTDTVTEGESSFLGVGNGYYLGVDLFNIDILCPDEFYGNEDSTVNVHAKKTVFKNGGRTNIVYNPVGNIAD